MVFKMHLTETENLQRPPLSSAFANSRQPSNSKLPSNSTCNYHLIWHTPPPQGAPHSLCAVMGKLHFWVLLIPSEVYGLIADCVQEMDFLAASLCHMEQEFLHRFLSSTIKTN